MAGLFVMQDRISRAYGSVFQMENARDVRRMFIQNVVVRDDVPDYAVSDVVILHVADIDYTGDFPAISPHLVPNVILRGDDIEIQELRKKALDESSVAPV